MFRRKLGDHVFLVVVTRALPDYVTRTYASFRTSL